jgi:hypothetical protein
MPATPTCALAPSACADGGVANTLAPATDEEAHCAQLGDGAQPDDADDCEDGEGMVTYTTDVAKYKLVIIMVGLPARGKTFM